MATSDLFKWRISNTLAGLTRNLFVRYGIPTPSQCQYKAYTKKTSQGEGGWARHGYRNLEILWLKLDPCQVNKIMEFYDTALAGTKLLYLTVKPLDGSGVAWMDVSGRPDLSDIAPDAPIIGASGYIHSNIKLTLNNVTVISEDPTF